MRIGTSISDGSNIRSRKSRVSGRASRMRLAGAFLLAVRPAEVLAAGRDFFLGIAFTLFLTDPHDVLVSLGPLSFSPGDFPPARMFMKRFRRSNQKGAPRETAKAVRARPASLFHQSPGWDGRDFQPRGMPSCWSWATRSLTVGWLAGVASGGFAVSI